MKLKLRGPLFQCGRCRKRYRNPLGHTCTVKTGYKRRTAKAGKDAAAAKRAAARRARPQHPPWSACRDGECKRTGCVAYRQGREDGYQDGYGEGFPDGMTACARTHQ